MKACLLLLLSVLALQATASPRWNNDGDRGKAIGKCYEEYNKGMNQAGAIKGDDMRKCNTNSQGSSGSKQQCRDDALDKMQNNFRKQKDILDSCLDKVNNETGTSVSDESSETGEQSAENPTQPEQKPSTKEQCYREYRKGMNQAGAIEGDDIRQCKTATQGWSTSKQQCIQDAIDKMQNGFRKQKDILDSCLDNAHHETGSNESGEEKPEHNPNLEAVGRCYQEHGEKVTEIQEKTESKLQKCEKKSGAKRDSCVDDVMENIEKKLRKQQDKLEKCLEKAAYESDSPVSDESDEQSAEDSTQPEQQSKAKQQCYREYRQGMNQAGATKGNDIRKCKTDTQGWSNSKQQCIQDALDKMQNEFNKLEDKLNVCLNNIRN